MIEMTAPPLPTLQGAVDALFAKITAGRARTATGTAVASGLTGRVTDLTPDELGILEGVFGSRFGDRLFGIWQRDELDVAGASEDDWALENEIGWQAISRGYEGDALHLVVERIMRAGPYRRKHDEPRGKVSWLAQDVANAIQTTQERRAKYDNAPVLVFDEEIHTDDIPADETPADETPEQTIARQAREIAQLRGQVAVQMTVIRAHNDVERQLREQIERLNRQIYADYRLGKVKTLTSSQKEAIKAMARVATKRAEHFDNDAPIITGETLGAEMGKCATTARTAAETVCSLPGSPIKRITRYRDDGTYGQLTTYELAVRDPAEILEQFVVIAENLEEKKSSRPQPPKCQNHPDAPVNTLHECSRCHEILELQPLCAKVVRIAPDSPPVEEQVVVPEQIVRIAPDPIPFPGATVSAPRCGHVKPNGRECIATLYRDLGGGWRHCLGCGHRSYELPAVMGASE